MFYSHEILTSRRYGVATIWLVATIGSKSSTRKVTRKAIQEVDVRGACGKILEPGAPIALRLQGNLLYGVSRVHNQQCTYLATDAKKIQDQMKLFFRNFAGNQLDPDAARGRPENLLIMNDPAFDPNMPLPEFNIDTLVARQGKTQKTSSQMSPLQNSQLSGSQGPRHRIAIQLDMDHSSSSSRPDSPFGLEGLSSAQKPDDEPLIFPQDDDIFGTQGDWGLEIDEDGNIVESAGPMAIDEEPQLPPLPPNRPEGVVETNAAQPTEQAVLDDQGDVIMQEEPLPEAEPFPEPQRHVPFQDDERPVRQAATRRKRKLQIDEETQLSRNVLRLWQSDYLEFCGARPTRLIPTTQAKRNAMLLTFGLGIGNIGQNTGVPRLVHPLAVEFSGDKLFTTITGIEVVEARSGRRRTASEAIPDDGEEEERRVRPRLMENEEEHEKARAGKADEFINLDDPFGDGALQEVGREPEHPMSDHLSSTLLPWNRGSSVVPGSSIRGPSSVKKGRDLSSPLGKRGDIQDIVRYSDDAPMGGLGSDGDFGGGFGSADSSFDGMPAPGASPEGEKQPQPAIEPTAADIRAQNERLFAQLDREGQNFLSFVEDAVHENGERRQDDDFDLNRKWVAFDDIFVPRTTPRLTAAQAFYHTLCLVTKGKIYVDQGDSDDQSFGAIWIGTKVPAGDL
ncbi:Rec8 like protein-domain-containing protein [Xylariaceae sp. FL1651]|nr:Rec8 like protein-domain-containing protein [Xylariaceae sp. FL1651]